MGVRWDLTVVLIYIVLMTNDVWHLFTYLSVICLSAVSEETSSPILFLLLKLGCFYLLSFYYSLYILDTIPLSDI